MQERDRFGRIELGRTTEGQMKEPLKHRTLSAAIVDQLRQAILDGTYPAGSQLRQDALGEAYGVSRIPVREALFQLEAEGLVRIVPQKGAIVSELSLDEINDVFDLRRILEPRLLAQSAPRFTADDFERARRHPQELREGDQGAQRQRMGPAQRRLPHGALRSRPAAAYARDRAVTAPDQRPLHAPPALQHQGDGDRREGARPSDRALPRAEGRGGLPVPGAAHRGRAQGSVAGGGRQHDRAEVTAEGES